MRTGNRANSGKTLATGEARSGGGRSGRENAGIEIAVVLDHGCGVEMFLGEGLGEAGGARSGFRLGQGDAERLSDAGGIAGAGEQRVIGGKNVAESGRIGGDDRQAGEGRLDGNEPETLVTRRHDQDIVTVEMLGEIGDRGVEVNVPRRRGMAGQVAKRGGVRAAAENVKIGATAGGERGLLQDFGDEIGAFFVLQTPAENEFERRIGGTDDGLADTRRMDAIQDNGGRKRRRRSAGTLAQLGECGECAWGDAGESGVGEAAVAPTAELRREVPDDAVVNGANDGDRTEARAQREQHGVAGFGNLGVQVNQVRLRGAEGACESEGAGEHASEAHGNARPEVEGNVASEDLATQRFADRAVANSAHGVEGE